MRILSFGHIPAWAGGRQESGLANVIYQLAKHGSEVDGTEVMLAATDCYVPERKDGRLTILGWTKAGIVRYMLMHPIRTIHSFMRLLALKIKYPVKERFTGLYLKRIFFEKSIRKLQPQVVHLHGMQTLWFMDLVPDKTKIVVTFHGMTGLDEHLPQHEVFYKMESDLFHCVRVNEFFFICTKLVGDFKATYGENKKRNIVIFNSYDKSKFYLEKVTSSPLQHEGKSGRQSNITTLCTVASLSDLKGQLRVLSALEMLPNRRKFRYFCIGGGDEAYAQRLKSYAQEHDIDFEYIGKMKPDEIRHRLQEADYMIMPSSSEGFGLTYLEAIACGVPVILPKNLPIAQEKKLINECNSILLEDCSEESIAKVLNIIESFNFCRECVAATIKGYTWDEIVRQYINTYKKLL